MRHNRFIKIEDSFCVNVERNLLCLCALHNSSTFLLQQKSWLCEKRSIQLLHTGENITTLIQKEMWFRKKTIAFIWHTFILQILFQIYFISFFSSALLFLSTLHCQHKIRLPDERTNVLRNNMKKSKTFYVCFFPFIRPFIRAKLSSSRSWEFIKSQVNSSQVPKSSTRVNNRFKRKKPSNGFFVSVGFFSLVTFFMPKASGSSFQYYFIGSSNWYTRFYFTKTMYYRQRFFYDSLHSFVESENDVRCTLFCSIYNEFDKRHQSERSKLLRNNQTTESIYCSEM